MCKDCIVADEYTAQLRAKKLQQEVDDLALKLTYFHNGGEISKCPPFTPGGLKVYSPDERPERGLIMTEDGPKVDFKERE
jgi:hypothetical protein